ncbi:nucleotidyltransferase domain-containing protein [Cetobacterium somerae]|uniref:Nucleotidyltransferase domain-containing protein n=1 Tax=Candidatus Cetobacterium colombiensis TaxID=3073100 RepID=A0ABU4WBI4_9FUSO|nr:MULTISPECIES: nucleotidyltransferase domain-containing protein [Cetobacterium]MCQ9627831.1 nucleotidyltransferase domain-containing protein [Cetobacterium somerae]MDX8336886.1 nucleotidyltransferase domain-containing protein [Candidatus Cetobacterium colombiensis]
MEINKESILSVLKALDKEKYSILEIGLFGSYAREEETDSSDIDIIVKIEFKKGMYRNFCALQEELENTFGKKVDLIEKSVFDYKFKNPDVKDYKEKVKEEILGSVIYV